MKLERFLSLRASFNEKGFLVLCIALWSCVCLCACSGAGPQAKIASEDVNFRAVGKAALEDIFNSYRVFEHNSFNDRVSSRFVPDRNAFLNGVEQNYTKSVLIEFNYFVDIVVKEDGFLNIGFHWEKKTQPYGSASLILTKGKTDFVFVFESDKWFLYQVRGDDPF